MNKEFIDINNDCSEFLVIICMDGEYSCCAMDSMSEVYEHITFILQNTAEDLLYTNIEFPDDRKFKELGAIANRVLLYDVIRNETSLKDYWFTLFDKYEMDKDYWVKVIDYDGNEKLFITN